MTATNRTPPPARARPHARRPDWLRAFSTDRATREPSPHTLQAYRQDFDAIAALVADDPQQIAALTPPNITKDSMRQAFAATPNYTRLFHPTLLVDVEHLVQPSQIASPVGRLGRHRSITRTAAARMRSTSSAASR
jgi:hypothetical protein